MFNRLTFEISGVCNARCPYCVTGSKINAEVLESDRFLTPKKAGSILDYLQNNQIIAPDIGIELYNWGEPFLNPYLNDVLEQFAGHGIGYHLSTNGSVYQPLGARSITALRQITFSFPGFSQASYDRIHGFDFNHIQNNVEALVHEIQAVNPTTRLIMTFHVYQFNVGELAAAYEWCAKQKIEFSPYLAYWNGYELARRYRIGQVKGSRDLILGYENSIIERFRNTTFRCPQWDMLTMDQAGRVVLCCVMDTSNPEYMFKDVLECSLEEIRKWKESRPVCQECISLGIAQWNNNPLFLKWSPTSEEITTRVTALEHSRCELRLTETRAQNESKLKETKTVYESKLKELKATYESTISWQFTKPIRVIGKLLGLRKP
jgi:pyruvate-formate lyase-activating enzyme